MKKYLAILVLIFGLQSWTKANDIRDFEIEGISIGDNLTNFFNEEEIVKESVSSKMYYYLKEPEKFTHVEFVYHPKLSTYDTIQVLYKKISGDYIVYAIIGKILFKDNINDCYDFRDGIVNDMEDQLKTEAGDKEVALHPSDKSKKSKVDQVVFWLKNDDVIIAECYDWSEEMGYYDNLKVNLFSNEANLWITDVKN